jgi:hypothetical protein
VGLSELGRATAQLTQNPTLPIEIQSEVNLDNITFVSNDHLKDVIARTSASPEQKAEALRINTESRSARAEDRLLHHGGPRIAHDAARLAIAGLPTGRNSAD